MSRFAISTQVLFGEAAESESLAVLKAASYKSVLFIVDEAVARTTAFLGLRKSYENAGFSIEQISHRPTSEPSYDELDDFVSPLRSCATTPDLIAAVGGGSILDLAKGTAILLTNHGHGVEYRGMDKVKHPGVPVVCYPTTAGTGSEVTHTASFIDKSSMTKLGINGRFVSPLMGVLLPQLAQSCPHRTALFSGLDAMLHALEATSARSANTLTVEIGAGAFALLFDSLPLVLNKPSDNVAWARMLLGSYWAGVAMMNAGGGPASGISYPLGAHFGVPHGIAGGIFLPGVVALNVARGYQGYAAVYDRIAGNDTSIEPKEKSKRFADQLRERFASMGAPGDLSEFGVNRKNVDILVQLTVEQRAANLELNPVRVDRKDIQDLLEAVTR